VREHLAQMGYRCLNEVIGCSELLVQRDEWRTAQDEVPSFDTRRLPDDEVDLSSLLVPAPPCLPSHQVERAPMPSLNSLNEQMVRDASPAVDEGWKVQLHYTIHNQDRSVGARLPGEITKRHMDAGLPPGTIEIDFRGYAGQSFGAFTTNGMRLHLVGAANDYVGKGMRGGEISIRPLPESTYEWGDNHILGNTVLYGAT